MTNETSKGRELAAVAPAAGGKVMALIPQTPEEIKWTIGMVVGAGLAPDSFKGDPTWQNALRAVARYTFLAAL